MVSSHDIAWAAGIYEGEGACLVTKDHKSGRPCSLVVTVAQKDPWMVNKLCDLFGGKIQQYSNSTQRSYWYWRLSVIESRGFLMTIYKFLSPRRRTQVLRAMWGGELWDEGIK